MTSPIEYRGTVKLPNKKSYDGLIRLDFTGHVAIRPGNAKLEGLSLRMFVPGKNSKDEQPEMSITLTAEQWLDLIDEMKAEFESVQKARKEFDDMR
jgi:hypothetical protein